jgi:hypothetical protein
VFQFIYCLSPFVPVWFFIVLPFFYLCFVSIFWILWVSCLAYLNLLGTKGLVVVIVVGWLRSFYHEIVYNWFFDMVKRGECALPTKVRRSMFLC